MKGLSEKVFLPLDMPTEEAPLGDRERIRQALEALGYENPELPLPVLRQLYPLCRDSRFHITATLVRRKTDWVVTALEPGDCRDRHYGLAVDYGSTTIVMELVDLNSGAVVAGESMVSGQTAFGTDILTRITYCMEDPAQHPAQLRRATVETFDALLDRLTAATGIDAAACPVMVVSGNTTMLHFLLELDAWTVFAAPYAPVCTDPGFLWGWELQMKFRGLVYFIPSASNYIGGDIVSGLLELELHKQERTSLFFDIGTNGELVIGNRQWMLAGAGAAGPALEGYISRFGMRADPGAIDRVKIEEGRVIYTTIQGAPPQGICGSGIIDLLAQMRLHRWIDISGALHPEVTARIVYLEEEGQYVAIYVPAEESATGGPLYFSQTDIYQYLDTKSAAYTMVECLLETVGIGMEDLEYFYLSGAFPAHSDLEAAITLGIFPDLPRHRFRCLRNTSLAGARKLLCNRALLEEAATLAENLYCLQLASVPDFLVRMQGAKFIPHTDLGRFPTIRARLGE